MAGAHVIRCERREHSRKLNGALVSRAAAGYFIAVVLLLLCPFQTSPIYHLCAFVTAAQANAAGDMMSYNFVNSIAYALHNCYFACLSSDYPTLARLSIGG